MQGYWRPGPCRAKVLLALTNLGHPAGLDEIRRAARVPEAPAAFALLQLERAGLLVRETNMHRHGFLWRLTQEEKLP